MADIDTRQYGLEWEPTLDTASYVLPKWSLELDIATIKLTCASSLGIEHTKDLEVSFLAEGALNKVYLLQHNSQKYIMRIPLPVDPCYKTSSETAVLKFLDEKTSIPVPKTIASSATCNNKLGFEWSLMTFVEGVPLRDVWFSATMDQKRKIIADIVHFHVQLFRNKFTGIGSLYASDEHRYTIGRMVSMLLWWYKRVFDTVSKGPFATVQSWLSTNIEIMLRETQDLWLQEESERRAKHAWTPALYPNLTSAPNNEYDLDNESAYEEVLLNLQRISRNLSKILERSFAAAEERLVDQVTTILVHPDLSWNNIMVDPSTCKITGIIDWENCAAIPLSAACELPKLLEPHTKPVEQAPDPDEYSDYNEVEDCWFEGELEGKGDQYHLAVLAYEQKQLRSYFLDMMAQECPEWITEYHKGAALRDFVRLISVADIRSYHYDVWTWLNWFESGHIRSLDWIEWGWETEEEAKANDITEDLTHKDITRFD